MFKNNKVIRKLLVTATYNKVSFYDFLFLMQLVVFSLSLTIFIDYCIETPTYKLEKFLIPFLTPLTENEYAVTDSLYSAEEICKHDSNLYIASLDVDSMFTNIPLDKAIDNFC